MKSREKIHEFVNMARHPEAKDLAEALKSEQKYDNCEILHTYENKEPRIINVQEFDWLRSEIYGFETGENKTLGRPITAFDVCWALQKTHTDLMIRFNGGNSIMVGRMLGGKFDCWFWLEAKNTDGDIFLTEWGDEVCDKITDEFI